MRFRIFCLLLVFAPALEAAESPWRLGAALGYGERSNPLLQSDDVPLVLDLDIAYFGEHFFFDNGDLGITFVDNAAVTASMMARWNSDRVFFGRTDTKFVNFDISGAPLSESVQLTVPDRDYAIEVGVELLSDGRWGFLQLSAFHDISGTHDGFEIDASYGFGFRSGNWYIEPEVGLAYKSEALNDYYWGVQPGEANEALPEYEVGDGINPRLRLRAAYYFSRDWSFALSAEYERLSDDASESPIVDRDSVIGYFAGIAYRF
ncbi:MAG: MipA/OmpV family protein [Woeseiaceae bacterium]|nr:MipA/OmpV family protein [Woeseiaceae bacterium]